MSSILDALEKLERRQEVLREGSTPPDRPARYGMTLAAVLLAFVAGIGIAFGLRPGTQSPARAPLAAPALPVAPAPSASPAVAAASGPPAAVAGERAAPAAAPAVPAVEPLPVRVATATASPPAAAATPAEVPRPVVTPPAPQAAARPARDAAPPAAAPVFARSPTGAPRLKLSFLVYSAVPERRRVALSIDDASMVTLHEGESAHDVEVERIFADHVELRHGGRTFTLRARD